MAVTVFLLECSVQVTASVMTFSRNILRTRLVSPEIIQEIRFTLTRLTSLRMAGSVIPCLDVTTKNFMMMLDTSSSQAFSAFTTPLFSINIEMKLYWSSSKDSIRHKFMAYFSMRINKKSVWKISLKFPYEWRICILSIRHAQMTWHIRNIIGLISLPIILYSNVIGKCKYQSSYITFVNNTFIVERWLTFQDAIKVTKFDEFCSTFVLR